MEGVDVNVKDKENVIFLMRVVLCNYKEVVKLLLEKGVDVNVVNDWGYSFLKYVKKFNLKEMENIFWEVGVIDNK